MMSRDFLPTGELVHVLDKRIDQNLHSLVNAYRAGGLTIDIAMHKVSAISECLLLLKEVQKGNRNDRRRTSASS